jgi:hypothetical protein
MCGTDCVADTVVDRRDTCPGHGMRLEYATHDNFMVDSQNHSTLWMMGFTKFEPKNLAARFRCESEVTRGVIAKD